MTPITTTAELAAFCDKLKGQPFVAVDTEFMRETTYWPKLCLIQAAAPNAEAVIDPLAEGMDLEPFLEILRDESIDKVFHAARQDVEIFNNLKAMPKPLFDTQVAGMAAGYGEQIAYDALVRQMLKIELDKSSRFTDWARRPLTEAQLTYALADVTHLAKLYPMLKARLEKEGRLAWVMDEMGNLCDPANYDVDPENAWRRLKPRKHTAKYLAVYRAVAAWRERTAQMRDQPRGRILKDEAIDELATQAPTDAAALDRLRSVPKGFSGSRFGPDLLAAVREALKDPEAYAPVIERNRQAPSPAAGAVVELLKVLLKARAEDAGVASKLIATVSDLEQIANDDEAKTPALTGWRREAFGEDALKLKRG
ncbi:MAG TPA: ribonuclease D, partial [Phenylobacterium sp.]|nr:ribonuclease D [Phenylobacterium sp.]